MSQSPPIDSTRDEASIERSSDSPTSQERDDDFTWGGYFLFLAERIFIYFTLYALSIGPLYWQWYQSQFVGGSGLLAAFYLPLVTLAHWCPPFGAWMDWYVSLWIM